MTDGLAALLAAARTDRSLALLDGFHALKHALRFGAEVLAAGTSDPERLARLAERSPRTSTWPWCRPSTPRSSGRMRTTPAWWPSRAGRRSTRRRSRRGPAVLLEDPRHLGNVGAVVRVAAAAGAAGVLTTGARDPWHPAALRGAAGLHFALPVGQVDAPPAGRPLVALDPQGGPLGALPEDALLAFGSERHGLSRELLARADARMAIPMRAGVSSLNLATAVAVALYTARSDFSQRSIVQAGRIPADS